MKYVRTRESFLSGIKEMKVEVEKNYENIHSKSNSLVKMDDYEMINEEAPLSNAISWGDSLLGRLINRIKRKIRQGVGMARIQNVIRQLKKSFDDLIAESKVAELTNEEQIQLYQLIIDDLLNELNAAIIEKYKVKNLKDMTDVIIEEVKSIQKKVKDKKLTFEGLDKLLEELIAFRKFLDQFKDDDGDKEFDEEPEEDEKEESDDTKVSDDDSAYVKYLNNFRSLLRIVNLWIKFQQEKAKQFSQNPPQPNTNQNKADAKTQIQNVGGEKTTATKTNAGLDIDLDKEYKLFEKENIKQIPEIKNSKLLSYLDFLGEAGFANYADYTKTKIGFGKSGSESDKKAEPEKNPPASKTPPSDPKKTPTTTQPNDPKVEAKYKELVDKWKEEQKKLGKNTSPGEGTRARIRKEAQQAVSGGGKPTDANPNKPQEQKADSGKQSPLFNLIKSLHGFVMQIMPPKTKGGESEDINSFLKMSDDALKQGKFKDSITKVYAQVKKKTGAKMNEDINNLLSRADALGERIGALYLESKNGKFDGLSPELQKELGVFNETMKACLESASDKKGESKFKVGDKVTWTSKDGNKVVKEILKEKDGVYTFKNKKGEEFTKKESELKKESILFGFDSYYRLLREAEGDEGDQDKGGKNTSTQIKTEWVSRFGPGSDIKTAKGQVIIDDSFTNELYQEALKKAPKVGEFTLFGLFCKGVKVMADLRKEIEDKLEKKKGALTLSMDPVLEIVKLFNRAYKIHTTKVIPNVETSDGKVSQSTYNEYSCFGDGTSENAGVKGGPYRHNATFNKWETAVLDIMGNRKYQPIFDPETTLFNGTRDMPKAGMYLRKFMNKLLDGEEMYGGGSSGGKGGAQAAFLDQYFGYTDADPSDLHLGSKKEADGERKENSGNSDAVKKATKDIQFKKDDFKLEQYSQLVGSIFTLSDGGKNGSNEHQYYFLVHKIDNTYAYVTFTRGFKFYHELILKYPSKFGNPAIGDMKGDASTPSSNFKDTSDNEYVVYATKIKSDLFDMVTGRLKPGEYSATFVRKKEKAGQKFTNKNTETELEETKKMKFKFSNSFTLALEGEANTPDGKKAFQRLRLEEFDSKLTERGLFPNISRVASIDKAEFKR